MTTLDLRVFGLHISVSVPSSRADSLREQWLWCLPDSPLQRTVEAIDGGNVAAPDDIPLARPDAENDEDGHTADYQLTTAVTGRAIAACSGRLYMLHAAGIADRDTGRVAGLVAASGTGKTTAARTFCGLDDFGYVTDETLVMNARGDVLPYPKPLSVVIDPAEVGHKSQHGPAELGFTPPPAGPLTLGPLVVLRRLPDAEVPTLEPLSVIEGLKAVLPQSSAMPMVPNCLDGLAELARRGGGFQQLTYTEVTDAVEALRDAFALPAAERTWEHVPGTWPTGPDAPHRYGIEETTDAPEPVTADTAFARAPFVDAVVVPEDGEALVLVGDLPVHLRGLGAHVWRELDEARTAADLVRSCVAEFGDHPQAEDLVTDTLTRLQAGRLLRRS